MGHLLCRRCTLFVFLGFSVIVFACSDRWQTVTVTVRHSRVFHLVSLVFPVSLFFVPAFTGVLFVRRSSGVSSLSVTKLGLLLFRNVVFLFASLLFLVLVRGERIRCGVGHVSKPPPSPPCCAHGGRRPAAVSSFSHTPFFSFPDFSPGLSRTVKPRPTSADSFLQECLQHDAVERGNDAAACPARKRITPTGSSPHCFVSSVTAGVNYSHRSGPVASKSISFGRAQASLPARPVGLPHPVCRVVSSWTVLPVAHGKERRAKGGRKHSLAAEGWGVAKTRQRECPFNALHSLCLVRCTGRAEGVGKADEEGGGRTGPIEEDLKIEFLQERTGVDKIGQRGDPRGREDGEVAGHTRENVPSVPLSKVRCTLYTERNKPCTDVGELRLGKAYSGDGKGGEDDESRSPLQPLSCVSFHAGDQRKSTSMSPVPLRSVSAFSSTDATATPQGCQVRHARGHVGNFTGIPTCKGSPGGVKNADDQRHEATSSSFPCASVCSPSASCLGGPASFSAPSSAFPEKIFLHAAIGAAKSERGDWLQVLQHVRDAVQTLHAALDREESLLLSHFFRAGERSGLSIAERACVRKGRDGLSSRLRSFISSVNVLFVLLTSQEAGVDHHDENPIEERLLKSFIDWGSTGHPSHFPTSVPSRGSPTHAPSVNSHERHRPSHCHPLGDSADVLSAVGLESNSQKQAGQNEAEVSPECLATECLSKSHVEGVFRAAAEGQRIRSSLLVALRVYTQLGQLQRRLIRFWRLQRRVVESSQWRDILKNASTSGAAGDNGRSDDAMQSHQSSAALAQATADELRGLLPAQNTPANSVRVWDDWPHFKEDVPQQVEKRFSENNFKQEVEGGKDTVASLNSSGGKEFSEDDVVGKRAVGSTAPEKGDPASGGHSSVYETVSVTTLFPVSACVTTALLSSLGDLCSSCGSGSKKAVFSGRGCPNGVWLVPLVVTIWQDARNAHHTLLRLLAQQQKRRQGALHPWRPEMGDTRAAEMDRIPRVGASCGVTPTRAATTGSVTRKSGPGSTCGGRPPDMQWKSQFGERAAEGRVHVVKPSKEAPAIVPCDDIRKDRVVHSSMRDFEKSGEQGHQGGDASDVVSLTKQVAAFGETGEREERTAWTEHGSGSRDFEDDKDESPDVALGGLEAAQDDNPKERRQTQRAPPKTVLDVAACNAYMNVLARCRANASSSAAAMSVFREMTEELGMTPDLKTFHTLMDTFAKEGDVQSVTGGFRALLNAGLHPNTRTFSIRFHAAAQQGDIVAAREALFDMEAWGVQPNAFVFTTLIHLCTKSGNYASAVRLFREMIGTKVKPTVASWTALLDACCKAAVSGTRLSASSTKISAFSPPAGSGICLTAEKPLATDTAGEGVSVRDPPRHISLSGRFEDSPFYRYRVDEGPATTAGRDVGTQGGQKPHGAKSSSGLARGDTRLLGLTERRVSQDDNALQLRLWLISAVRAMLACGVFPNERTCNVLLYGLLRHPNPAVHFNAAVDVCRFIAEGGFSVNQLTFTSLISGLHKRAGPSSLSVGSPRFAATARLALLSYPRTDEPARGAAQANFGDELSRDGERSMTPVSISSFLRDALRPPDPGMKALLRRLFISFSRLEAVYSLLREQTAGFSARTQAESEQPSLQRSRERQTGTASLLGSAHFGASDETAACVGRQDAGREDGLHTTCPHSDKAQNTLSRPAVEAAFRALSTIRSVAMKLTGDFRGSSPRGLDNALHSASQSHLMRVAVQSAVTRARAVGHFLDVFLALRRRRGGAVLGADSRTSGNRLRRAVPEGTTVNGSRVFGVPSLDEASNGTSLDLRQPTRQGNTASVSSAVPPQTMSTSFDRGPCVPANKSGFASRPFVEKCWLCSLLPSERRLLRAAIENIERLADGSVHHCLENSDQLLQARGLSDKTLFGSLSSIPEMLSPGASRETDMRGGSGEGTEGFSLPSSSTSVCHHGGGGRSGDALSEGPRMTLWSSVQQETSDVPHSQSGESGQVLSAEGSPFVIAVESRKGGATQQSKATHVFSRDASQQPTELTKLTARPQCSDRIMEGKAGVQLLCQSASRAVSPDGLLRVEQRSESPSKVRSRGHVAEVRSTTANKLAPSSSLGKGRYNSFSIVNPTQGYQLRTVENGAREALGKLFRLAEATLLSSSVFSSPSHFPDERSDDNRQPVKSITRFERTVGHPALSGGASARLAEAFALFKALVQAGGGAEVPMPFPGKSAGRPVSVLESGGRTRDSQRKTEETEKWTEEESVFRRQREGAARVPGERSDQEEMRLWVVPDVAAFNALLNACAQAGHLALAHAVFTTMQQCGVFPDLLTYTVLIKACGTAGEVDAAESVFRALKLEVRRARRAIAHHASFSVSHARGDDKALGGSLVGEAKEKSDGSAPSLVGGQAATRERSLVVYASSNAEPGVRLGASVSSQGADLPVHEPSTATVLDDQSHPLGSLAYGQGHSEMISCLHPTEFTYYQIMQANYRAGRLDRVWELWEELRSEASLSRPDRTDGAPRINESFLRVTKLTVNWLLRVCAEQQLPREALTLCKQANEFGVRLSSRAYRAVRGLISPEAEPSLVKAQAVPRLSSTEITGIESPMKFSSCSSEGPKGIEVKPPLQSKSLKG